jgi:hypothetical protein
MEKVTGMDGVRVATLNLWGRSGAWAERRSVLVDGFRELRPDLVAFQEPIKSSICSALTSTSPTTTQVW